LDDLDRAYYRALRVQQGSGSRATRSGRASLKDLRSWARESGYSKKAGPTKGAVLFRDGKLWKVELTGWNSMAPVDDEAQRLEKLKPMENPVVATFVKGSGGWSATGTAISDRGFPYNVYASGSTLPAARKAVEAKLAEHNARRAKLDVDPAAKLEALLKSHDWYSAYSDHPGVAQAGMIDHRRIQKLMQQVPKATAARLWKKYAPADHR